MLAPAWVFLFGEVAAAGGGGAPDSVIASGYTGGAVSHVSDVSQAV